MNSITLVRGALLLLVGASLATWAVKTWRTSPAAAADAATGAAAGAAAAATLALIADGVAVVNFHGKLRCSTCLGIGALSQAVVDEEFASEQDAGLVAWSSIDFDEPANAHFRDEYDLASSNVVVVRRMAGADVGFQRLDDVWTHYDDEPAFRAYVHAAVAEALAGN